jgi:xylulokinase
VPLVVGVDLGTQSLKAVVCDADLRVLGDHQVPVATVHPQAGWAEQDPASWEAALAPAIGRALAQAGASPTDVAAIALAGQLDGCVPVGRDAEPLHAALIWQDRRAHTYANLADPARVFAIAGQIADPSHLAPKLAWLRAHGVRAARWHQPTSYLVARLTGEHVLDPAHASTMMLFDLAAGAWSPELCAAFAVDPSELPEVRAATALAGTLHARGAVLTGLPAGTRVAVGTGDDFATPLGAGVVAPGHAICAIGTAEVVGALAATPVFDGPPRFAEPFLETHAYPSGAYFVENPGWLSGGAVRWATQLLGLGSDAELDALAASSQPGAGGVTFIPALAGAMTPVWRPHARGTLHGLAASHGRAHIARAVLEGLAFAERDVVDRLAALGLPTASVLVLGGGGKSRTWTQIRADVLGRPHHVAARTDTCAIGAAMIAAVAAELAPDLATAARSAPPPSATFVPGAPLDDAYARYQRLQRELAELGESPWV